MRVKWLDAAPPSRRATSFAVYRVDGDASAIDVEDAANLVATLRTTGGTEQGRLDAGAEAGTRYTYAVTALDRVWNETVPRRVRRRGSAGGRSASRASGRGTPNARAGGDGTAVASVTTGAPAMKRRSSVAVDELRRCGVAREPSRQSSERQLVVRHVYMTTLPKRRPFSIDVSAVIATCGNTCARVAACERANARPAPSATLTATIPPGARRGAMSP